MKTQLIILAFLIGLIYCATQSSKLVREGFGNNEEGNCPNLLIKRGNKIMLLNNRKAKIPGINPIYFDNLEDYVEFTNWQRSQGIYCPVLYFNEVEDAQGNTNYRMMKAIDDPQAGLPSYDKHMAKLVPLYNADMDNPPYNQSDYPGFDPTNQNVGRYTPLDKAFYSNKRKSANAMDVNWAGSDYSKRMVDAGKYNKNFRPNAKDKFAEFKDIEIEPPSEHKKVFQHRMPRTAGASLGEPERDRAKKHRK